jgi:hypothetical protein
MTFAGETNESHDNIIHGGLSLGRDLNHGSPEYSARVPATLCGRCVIKTLLILDSYVQEEVKRKCVYRGR